MLARSLADAEMDLKLRRYAQEAHARRDLEAIRDAERARQIRGNPKFLALVDLMDALDVSEPRGRRPDRVSAAAALLNTAAIQLEPDTTKRGARTAAKVALRMILAELSVGEEDQLDVTRQILIMARDWARERAKFAIRARMHATGPRAAS
jgi:hypothetical protein